MMRKHLRSSDRNKNELREWKGSYL
uniref:Uncharacterized protein n=1 Tax=Anguilla anguilla TaxID=7936 RepID=A0A0E9RP74_ANGAN